MNTILMIVRLMLGEAFALFAKAILPDWALAYIGTTK